MLMLPFVISNSLLVEPVFLDYIPQNQAYHIETLVFNSSNGVPIVNNIGCYLYLYSKGSQGEQLAQLYDNTSNYEFDLNANNFSEKGEYCSKVRCNNSITGGMNEQCFYVTQSGNPPAGDIFTSIIYLLFIITSVLLFYTFFLMIFKLVVLDMTVYDILLAWTSFILVLVVNYLGKEYLIQPFVENMTNYFMIYTGWTNVFLPLCVFVVTFIYKTLQKKKPLSPQEISGFRGGYRYG